MLQGMGLLLFVVFALALLGMYLAIRRNWVAPVVSTGVGIALSIILMTLISFSQGNPPIQAIIVGLVVGGLFGGATLAVAWYFQAQALRTSGAETEAVYDEYAEYSEEQQPG